MSEQRDHFSRFGLPRRYALDRKALDSAYERLSFEHHPDLLAGASPDRQQAAQEQSAGLNEGYRILRSDGERAAYLLGLLADGRTLNPEALPNGFLQAMFLLQEEIDELDTADSKGRASLRSDVEEKLTLVLAERGGLFAQIEGRPGGADLELLQQVQSNLNEERYLHRLLERL
jgi:Fe-S protein assembly co-chaperone HscB